MPRYLFPPGPVELYDKQDIPLDPPITAEILDDGFTIEGTSISATCTTTKSFLKAVHKSRFHKLYYVSGEHKGIAVADMGVWTNEEDQTLQASSANTETQLEGMLHGEFSACFAYLSHALLLQLSTGRNKQARADKVSCCRVY